MALHSDIMYVDPAYHDELRRADLDTAENVLRCVGDRLAAWSRSTDAIQVDLRRNGTWPGSVFIKRYHYPRWKHRIRGMFRGTFVPRSSARAEYDALRVMRSLGIQAVRPVAYGERRIFHFLRSCFLVTEAVPNSISLATFAQRGTDGSESPIEPAARREIIASLARQIRHMHDSGFVHGRLFWRNILIRSMPDRRYEFYFLDASSGRRLWRKSVRRASIVKDLARMAAAARYLCTRADMVRFVRNYLSTRKLNGEHREWMRRVAAISERFVRHEVYRQALDDLFDMSVRHAEGVL